MPAGRDLHSPAPNAVVMRPHTPQEYISPSTRRHVSHTSHSPLPTGVQMNDDEAEKKARRRSRVMELQRHNLSSPSSPADRRRSAPLSGLSNNQLAEHYSSCIKLSAENKINSKNAFGLHLIDYMADLLKKKELNNFQVASSTLDASAKIYAGRVDAIHTDTYKMLGGLGRGQAEGDKEKNGDVPVDADQEEDLNKKRKRARKSNTVEQNLKNINVSKFDLEFEVDPLFQKTSAAFDEGGTSGLLLNHLRCMDDSSELVLDSNTVLMGTRDTTQNNRRTQAVDLQEFKDLYQGVNLQSLQICPLFADFEFTNWNKDSEDSSSSMFYQLGRGDHAFDIDAEHEPIPGTGAGETAGDLMDDDFGDEYNDAGNDSYGSSTRGEPSVCIGDGTEAKLVQSAISNITHGTIGTLLQVLAAEPGEYSYFNTDLLQTWAGPDHWKLRPQSKESKYSVSRGDTTRKNKEKKQAFRLDYDQEVDFDSYFKESRAATTLTKATLEKYSKSQTTLPEDLHYEAETLFRLFMKERVMVKRQLNTSGDVDDGIENYDYDNANDRENYCPGIDGANDNDDDDDDLGGGFNLSSGPSEYSHISQDTSQGSFLANDSVMNGTILAGDNLVAQPNRVAKIDISYAKTAKKIDVKKLKAGIWNLLTSTGEDNKENQGEGDQLKKQVCGEHSFQSLLHELPKKVSRHMAKNLSVPIAFVCLLHLANEKTLKISDNQSMVDLRIEQGMFPST